MTVGNPRCWWCGAAASSGEHKFKRSDLVRAFGDGAWRGPTAVAHLADRVLAPQSSRAKGLKFEKSLCHSCNTARSQAFDRAYDALADYIRDSGDYVLSTGILDWNDVFGDAWQDGMELLTRYWVKHIGCRLAQVGAAISPGMIEFLDGSSNLRHVQMGLEIREDVVAVMGHLADTHGESKHSLWLGPAMGHVDRSSGVVVQMTSHTGINWLRLWYDYDFVDPTGSVSFGDRKVELPRGWSIDPTSVVADCRVCRPEGYDDE
ncbi:hypothetical protein [Nocardioides sp. zg-DK7169]|uniref:hypothetical protein n=1 Tax=Nocardioides sp. zg-DK7169 TaxID=2736600 RepID=UPI00155827FE|nr:hypothetical protein [Nocardioides sp. zg-DK7169]NPC99125.1 hypothetical protein [Nocardioides sp. zg-DK7169]